MRAAGALDKIRDRGTDNPVKKRILLWVGLFLGGAILGFELAWFLKPGLAKNSAAVPSSPLPRAEVSLTLSAAIDGSDRFIFTRDNVWNEHGQWGPPAKVLFNGAAWEDLTQPPPGWIELARDLDLRAAKLATRAGRDVVALEPTAEGFDLLFADTPMGAGKYSVTISIPKKP